MPTKRFGRIAQLLVSGCAVMFAACVVVEHAQAQPGYVTRPTPLPPPVFNPSNPSTVPQAPYRPITPTTPTAAPGDVVTSPLTERLPRTTAHSAHSHPTSVQTTRSMHHHRRRSIGVGPTLGSFYCP